MTADAGMRHQATKIQEVYDKVSLEVTGRLDPQEVLFVFDLDGTLTSDSQPNDHLLSDESYRVMPRGNAIEVVQTLHRQGFKILVSSGWKNFRGTLERIRRLGLAGAFDISKEDTAEKVTTEFNISDKGIKIQYFMQGNCVSARNGFYGNFVAKAFSPYFLWQKEDLAEVRKVIFIDDSEFNIDVIENHVTKYKLYPNADVDYYLLGNPSLDSRDL
jgi:hypothetical protein